MVAIGVSRSPLTRLLFRALLNADTKRPPHKVGRSPRQPFSPGRRALEFLSPLLGERARVRAAKDSGKKIIFLFSNALFIFGSRLLFSSLHFLTSARGFFSGGCFSGRFLSRRFGSSRLFSCTGFLSRRFLGSGFSCAIFCRLL